MARIRTIKPDFFLHEGLAELTAAHRLLFLGLWTLADREGRLEDRPKRIKAALFPYEPVEVDALLWDLAEAGFIQRYEAGGVDVVSIPSFLKHQRPHPKEAASDLPALPTPAAVKSREIKRQAVKGFSSIPSAPVGREGKESQEGDLGREGDLRPASPAVPPPLPDTGADFFAKANAQREQVHGLPPEKPPRHPDRYARWFGPALAEFRGDEAWMLAAHARFLCDPYWKNASPAWPFAAFAKDPVRWAGERPAPPPDPCAIEGCGQPGVSSVWEHPVCLDHVGAAQSRWAPQEARGAA